MLSFLPSLCFSFASDIHSSFAQIFMNFKFLADSVWVGYLYGRRKKMAVHTKIHPPRLGRWICRECMCLYWSVIRNRKPTYAEEEENVSSCRHGNWQRIRGFQLKKKKFCPLKKKNLSAGEKICQANFNCGQNFLSPVSRT